MLVTAPGALLLMLEGWFHFVFVCIASSLLIVKGVRPMQQVAFSHHSCLSDNDLVLRVRILRPQTTVLIRPSIQLDVCLTTGLFVKLPLVCESYAKWSGNPTITVRHLITEDSPFFDAEASEEATKMAAENRDPDAPPPAKVMKSSMKKIAHLSASLVAQDKNGTKKTGLITCRDF